jgi:hypothetical protein
MNDNDTVNVYKLEVMIIDHDRLGIRGCCEALENGRFGNRCISPHVMAAYQNQVQWSDDHDLNKDINRSKAAFDNLFD